MPAGPGIRDDSGVVEGDEVSIYYDPMISKLAAWGRTRSEAINRMRRALDEYAIGGIKTTLSFFRDVIRDQEFIDAKLDTGYIGRFNDRRRNLSPPVRLAVDVESDMAVIAAALAYRRVAAQTKRMDPSTTNSKWKMSGRAALVNNALAGTKRRV